MLSLAPSILTADFGHLSEEIDRIVMGGADMIHVDVMDGVFVPNMSIGPVIVSALRRSTDLPLDVHLMISEPETMIPAFAAAGADSITVHYETCPQLHHTVSMIRELGLKAAVVLNPGTPVCVLDSILPYLDMVLLMSVNPGFGGQKFIPTTTRKIAELKKMIADRGLDIDIEVDGGVNDATIESVVRAGANIVVVGSAIYDGKDPEGNARRFRDKLNELEATL